jgi:hypothetical protein
MKGANLVRYSVVSRCHPSIAPLDRTRLFHRWSPVSRVLTNSTPWSTYAITEELSTVTPFPVANACDVLSVAAKAATAAMTRRRHRPKIKATLIPLPSIPMVPIFGVPGAFEQYSKERPKRFAYCDLPIQVTTDVEMMTRSVS